MDPDDGLLAGAELAAVLRAHGLEPVPDDPPRRVTPRVLHLRRTGGGIAIKVLAPEHAAAARAREEQGGGRSLRRVVGDRRGDRLIAAREDVATIGGRQLHERALGHVAEERDAAGLGIAALRGAQEEPRAVGFEHRERVVARRAVVAEVVAVELERRAAVDLVHDVPVGARDDAAAADRRPAAREADRDGERAREQQQRRGVAEHLVAVELVGARVLDRVAGEAPDDRRDVGEPRPKPLEDRRAARGQALGGRHAQRGRAAEGARGRGCGDARALDGVAGDVAGDRRGDGERVAGEQRERE